MSKISPVTHLAPAALLFCASALASAAKAQEISFNIGWASEYHYRGLLQKQSSASAGVDFSSGGFYAGGWTADVGDGLEVDGYLGYGIETEAGFSASFGFTGYYYTGDFDDTYEELNSGLGGGRLGIECSFGSYDSVGGPKQDYSFLAATLSDGNGLYGTFGSFGGDFAGNYLELGYGLSVSEIDLGIAAIFSSDEFGEGNGQFDSAGKPAASQALVFTIGKTF